MGDTLHRIGTRFIRQDEGGLKKEWFHSDAGDLLIWRDRKGKGEIAGFELTFLRERGRPQGYVNWERSRLIRTGSIDAGREAGAGSELVSVHTRLDPAVVAAAAVFVADPRCKIPEAVREFVLARLQELTAGEAAMGTKTRRRRSPGEERKA